MTSGVSALPTRCLPHVSTITEIGSMSGLAQLEIDTSKFEFWVGVKGNALASQLCIRKTFMNWSRVTAGALSSLAQ